MEEQDIKQFKKIIDDSLEEKFKENNKRIFEHIDDKIDEAAQITYNSIQELQKDIEEVKKGVEKRPTRDDFSNWRDKQVEPLARDIDKVKYLHRKEWRKLPNSGIISRTLAEEVLKTL